MFRFFKRRRAKKAAEQAAQEAQALETQQAQADDAEEAPEPAAEPVAVQPETAPVEPVPTQVQPEPEATDEPVSPVPEPKPTTESTDITTEPVVEEMPEPESPSSPSQVDSAPSVEDERPTAEVLEVVEPVAKEDDTARKKSWMSRLRQGLSRTGRSIGGLFVGSRIDEAFYEDLESALIMADAGVQASTDLIAKLRKKVSRERLENPAQVRAALVDVLAEHLQDLEKPFDVGHVKPLVVMIAGVNGAGKTTSIGKLAFSLQKSGQKVLLAAGDTFRAAAREQLVEWGERNNVSVIAQSGGDPAAVAFDAVHAAHARDMDVLMVDTAGRLPTQLHLMEELKKIARVVRKADESAPHEVLLVVDGNTGQNALAQVKAFDDALTLTGLIVTKLDGTAKGGVLAALASGAQGCRPVPVYWVGVGEQIEDLQPFNAREFAQALVGEEES